MKTLKSIVVLLALVATFGPARAGEDSSTRYSMRNVVNLFIDAFAHGQFDEFDAILDRNSKLTIRKGDSVKSYTKTEILRMLAPFKNVDQNCVTTASMLEDLPGQVMVKVDMRYKNFSRINYISIAQGKNGWNITNISSMFIES